MGKIHVVWQFFVASDGHGNFFKKNLCLDKVNGSMRTKFQVCIILRLARRRDTNQNTYTREIRNILDRLLASRGF